MTTASKGNGHKRKRRRPSASLKASPDAMRKQVTPRKRQQARRHENGGAPGLDMVGLMNRRATAYFELSSRIVRCHSPFEVWRAQARFMQEGFTDCARVLLGGR